MRNPTTIQRRVLCAIAAAMIVGSFALVASVVRADSEPAVVDEDLFTLHAVQYLYDRWPSDFSETASMVAQLRAIDRCIGRLKAGAEVRKADSQIIDSIDDCRAKVVAYQTYLRDTGAIAADTSIAADRDTTASVQAALKAGVEVGQAASDGGYSDRQSAGAGLIVGIAALAIDSANREQRREAARQQQQDAADEALNRACDDIVERNKLRAEKIETAKGWTSGSAGLDGFVSKSMHDLKVRRPDDLFLEVENAAIREENETAESVHNDSETCVRCFQRVPKGSTYDVFRELFLNAGVQIGVQAAVMDLKDQSYTNGPSKYSPRALEMAEMYLALPYANASIGNYQLARAKAANGDLNGAINAANLVDKADRDSTYSYIYAKLMSMYGNTDNSLAWLRVAFADGHSGVAHARTSPDFANLREKLPTEFTELTTVKNSWSVTWGYQINNDQISLTNKSAFALTNVVLTPSITSSGYPDWSKKLQCDRIDPGETYTWKLGVSEITSRGDDYKSEASLDCDQD